MEHFKAAAVAIDTKGMDSVLRYCAIGRQLGYAMYLSLDAITYVNIPPFESSGTLSDTRAARLFRDTTIGKCQEITERGLQGVVYGVDI